MLPTHRRVVLAEQCVISREQSTHQGRLAVAYRPYRPPHPPSFARLAYHLWRPRVPLRVETRHSRFARNVMPRLNETFTARFREFAEMPGAGGAAGRFAAGAGVGSIARLRAELQVECSEVKDRWARNHDFDIVNQRSRNHSLAPTNGVRKGRNRSCARSSSSKEARGKIRLPNGCSEP